ncbi:MAG: glycosyltransferase family 9 protein, partial [Verrucomicrobiota bacterium]
GVRIDWVVRREFESLVAAAKAVDRTLVFERSGGLRAFRRLIREIREQSYDAVLDMQGLARSGILTACSRARRRIGRADAREFAGLAYGETTAALPKERPRHAVEILGDFLSVLGLDRRLARTISFRESDRPVDLPTAGGRRVVLFPESRRAEKNWAGYEALSRKLLERPEVGQVVWCGHLRFEAAGPMDAPGFFNLTGATGIDQLPALLRHADCVVSNDSGPMHLAAALGRPLVALFGPTDPARFGPYPKDASSQRVIRRADGAMASVTPEEVLRAVVELLSR